MAKRLIFDTNVFYDLGSGRITLNDIVQPGETIYISPVSLLELVGKIDENYETRRRAAQAIIDSKAVQLDDPETHLARLFNHKLKYVPYVDYIGVASAIANSKSPQHLPAGVANYPTRTRWKVIWSVVKEWRRKTEGEWVESLITMMKSEIPRFNVWYNPDPRRRASAKVPRLTGKMKQKLLDDTKKMKWYAPLSIAVWERSFENARVKRPKYATPGDVKSISQGMGKVDAYLEIYTQYLIHLLTGGALPEPNDSGDSELFIYSNDDNSIVVTGETKWCRFAKLAGLSRRVRFTR